MALPGLLIEYLVSGSLALLWALPLMNPYLSGIESAQIAALVPAIYVLGMLVDTLAFLIVTARLSSRGSLKDRVRWIAVNRRKHKGHEDERKYATFRAYLRGLWDGIPLDAWNAKESLSVPSKDQIRLLAEKPDLAAQVQMRSSRDRIARGAIVNFGIAGMAFVFSNPLVGIAFLALTLFAIPMWGMSEGISHNYKIDAISVLNPNDDPS